MYWKDDRTRLRTVWYEFQYERSMISVSDSDQHHNVYEAFKEII